jgi:hypothetical protein
LSISASDHWDDAAVRLSDAVAALFGAVTQLNVPMFPWTFPVVRSFVANHGAAFSAQRNRIPEPAATIRKNGARGAFRMSHNCNLPGIGLAEAFLSLFFPEIAERSFRKESFCLCERALVHCQPCGKRVRWSSLWRDAYTT